MIHNKYCGFGEDKPREFTDYAPTLRTPAGGGHIPDVKIETEEVVPLTEARTEEAKQVRREMQKEGKDWCGRRDKQLQPKSDGHVGAVTTGKSNEQLLCVASRGGGGRKTDEQELEARDDGVTNTLTNIQKDNYVLSKGGDGKLHTPEDVSQCLESGTSGGGGTSNRPHVLEKTKIRRLMPIEYERLQDFPDDYTEYGIGMKGDKSVIGFHFENQEINDDGEMGEVLVEEFAKAKEDGEVIKISDTARYQVLGNAVTVSVVAHVIGKLFNAK